MEKVEQERRTANWQAKTLRRVWPFNNALMRPADVTNGLTGVMLSQRGLLEDVSYSKIVPNHYIIEINQDNYMQNYQPIAGRIIQQWTESLLRRLMTANSRLGRREYRFGGRVKVEIRPVVNIDPSTARVLYRVEPDEVNPTDPGIRGGGQQPVGIPCVEVIPGGQRWLLNAPMVTIGRDAGCDIVLDQPLVQQTRLVSGRHAHIRQENGRYTLFDGAPYGRPSLNGTFVNRRPVPQNGIVLQNGDTIILAALDPNDPRPDTPGVVAFRFHTNCS